MAQTTLSVRIDSEDKKRFEEFCSQTGMNVSVAVNMFVKSVLRESKLPFEVKADPFFSEANLKRLRESAAQMEASGGTVHEVPPDDLGVDRRGMGGFCLLADTGQKNHETHSADSERHRQKRL